jgi:hypothetical protein
MKKTLLPDGLADFLVEAKKLTYASGGSGSTYAVSPLLALSHQLEYRQGDFTYRDIYFGEFHFAGQEVVCHKNIPIWSMCYAGGWTNALKDEKEVGALASVLQAALRNPTPHCPFRGPDSYRETPYRYLNTHSGDLYSFEGRERIEKNGEVPYKLSYCGGLLD